jgi:hypothetical protein
MIPYDSVYHVPPAPMARVTLRNRLNGKAILDVPMLIDTGADISVVPRASAEHIGLQSRRDESTVIVAYDGSRRSSEAVTLGPGKRVRSRSTHDAIRLAIPGQGGSTC